MVIKCFNSVFPTDPADPQKACYAVERLCAYLTITKPRLNLASINFTLEKRFLDGCQNKPARPITSEDPITRESNTGLLITQNTGDTDDYFSSTEGSTFEASLTFPQLGTSYIKVDLYKLCKPNCCIDKVVETAPAGSPIGRTVSLSFDYEWEKPESKTDDPLIRTRYPAWESFLSDLSRKGGKLGEFFSNFLKGGANFTGLEIDGISKNPYGESDVFIRSYYRSNLIRLCNSLVTSLSCDKANEVCGDCVPVTPDPRFSTFVDQSTL